MHGLFLAEDILFYRLFQFTPVCCSVKIQMGIWQSRAPNTSVLLISVSSHPEMGLIYIGINLLALCKQRNMKGVVVPSQLFSYFSIPVGAERFRHSNTFCKNNACTFYCALSSWELMVCGAAWRNGRDKFPETISVKGCVCAASSCLLSWITRVLNPGARV